MNICLLLGGPEYTIIIGGKPYRFEYNKNRYGGPMPVTKTGDERHLGPRHLFWTAVSLWIEQGMRLNPDWTCAWSNPPDPMGGAVQVGPRIYVSKDIAAKFGLPGGQTG